MAALYFIFINVLAFCLFGIDKHRASSGKWRIRESTLILTAIAGGSAGALIGMHVFHHKTRKLLFQYGIVIILILQCLLLFLGSHNFT